MTWDQLTSSLEFYPTTDMAPLRGHLKKDFPLLRDLSAAMRVDAACEARRSAWKRFFVPEVAEERKKAAMEAGKSNLFFWWPKLVCRVFVPWRAWGINELARMLGFDVRFWNMGTDSSNWSEIRKNKLFPRNHANCSRLPYSIHSDTTNRPPEQTSRPKLCSSSKRAMK